MRKTLFEEAGKSFVDASIHKIAKAPSVLDVGGSEPFTKWMRDYQFLFDGVVYKTFDYDASTKPDIVGDIHALPLNDESQDAIICSSVLEHVRDPIRAFAELERVLKPGGQLFLYVPSLYPYHARVGHYADYWRFFDDSLRELMQNFTHVEFCKRGGYFLALSFFVPGQHRLRGLLNLLARGLDWVFATERRATTAGYYVYAIK